MVVHEALLIVPVLLLITFVLVIVRPVPESEAVAPAR